VRASEIFKAAARARGVSAKFSAKKIDRGWERFANGMKSLQTDKSFVKAGLLGSKANRKRKAPARIFGESHAAEFAKAQAAINPVLLAVLAHAGRTHNSREQPTNVEIGIWNEFGSKTHPARPFIRPAFEKNRAEYLNLLALFVKAHVMTGRRTYVQTLGLIGQRMAADMKNYVTQGPQIPPPNSGYPNTERGYWAEKLRAGYWKQQKRNESLARRKKPPVEGPIPPPRTLVNTGSMVNSITYGVVARSSGDLRRKAKR
jgi:hypothetical protein